MTTKQTLINMLTENTGRHFLDSGGAYGRNFERNQLEPDWDSRPAVVVNTDCDFIDITLDLYHFLADRVSTDETTDRLNTAFTKFSERNDDPWVELLQSFTKRLGWDQSELGGCLSYNSDNALSQDIQFWVKDDSICILQIHGGCDIRGGWTKPVFFWLNDDHSIYDFARLTALVEPKVFYDNNQIELIPGLPRNEFEHIDSDDAGYTWYVDGCYSDKAEFEIVDNQVLMNGRKVEFVA